MKKEENQYKKKFILKGIIKEGQKPKKSEIKVINTKDIIIKKSLENTKSQNIIKKKNEKVDTSKTKKNIENSINKEFEISQNNNKLNKKEVDIVQNKLSSKKNNLNLKLKEYLKNKSEKNKSLINEKNKETISTNMHTLSSERNTLPSKKINKNINLKNENDYFIKDKNQEENNIQEIIEFKKGEINNNETQDSRKRKKKCEEKLTVFTPLPLNKKNKGEQIDPLSKDIQNAIMLRRQEYNDYIKSLNKLKPKKIKPKQKSKPKTKEKVFDENKVKLIQRIYKGFSTRIVNQTINRAKVNICAIELLCLIFSDNIYHAKKRISFQLLKLYYFEPFTKIDNEVDFNDRLNMKLSNKYYSFEELVLYKK